MESNQFSKTAEFKKVKDDITEIRKKAIKDGEYDQRSIILDLAEVLGKVVDICDFQFQQVVGLSLEVNDLRKPADSAEELKVTE